MQTRGMTIVSGGQSGADRAALDAAIALGIPHGGWVPRGRLAEDGPVPRRYHLREMVSRRYRDRTEKNVVDSDGTLILSLGPLSGGSALTEALALRHDKPCLHLDLELVEQEQAARAIDQWLHRFHIRVLNVAGPRLSSDSRIYEAVYGVLLAVNWEQLTRGTTSLQSLDRPPSNPDK